MQHEPLESRKPNRKLRHKVQSPLFFNRELSWLEFNARVLDEANNPRNPLLERLKFLAIFSSNLDEFFMIYVSGMRERVSQETGKLPTEQSYLDDLRAIKARLEPLLKAQYDCYPALLPCLAQAAGSMHSCQPLYDKALASVRFHHVNRVFPVVSPRTYQPRHQF